MATFDLKRVLQVQAEGKALGPNRFFYDQSPISTYAPGRSTGNDREKPYLSQSEASRHLEAYGGNDAIDWVMDAVGLYADTASTAKWHVEKGGKKLVREKTEDTPKGVEVADPAFVRLIDQPNPFQDYIELIELLVIDLLLVGNAYWLKWRPGSDGRPLALYRMAPSHVKVRGSAQGVEKYAYQPPGQTDPTFFDPRDVIQFKRPNPHSQYYGMGVIKGGGRPLDLELAITNSQAYYFENKADPSLIVQSERRVPRDVFNKLRAQIRARASGPSKTGELLVLEAGLKAMTLTPTAAQAMYSTLAGQSRDRVLAMFRVNPKLLGIAETGGSTDKVQDFRREFDTKVMRPFLDKLQTRITNELASAWDYKYVIDYKYIMPPEDLVKLSGDFGSVPGVKVKEVRRFLVEGGMLDEESTGDATIDDVVLNLPGENAGANGTPVDAQGNPLPAGFADQSLPREAGRPPKIENTKPFPSNGAPLPAGARARRPQGKALTVDEVLARLEHQIEEHKAMVDRPTQSADRNKLPNEQRPKDRFQTLREHDVDLVTADVKGDLLEAMLTLERGLMDHAEGKAFNGKTLVTRLKKSAAWQTFVTAVTAALEKGAQRALSLASIHSNDAGIPATELDYQRLVKEIVFRRDGVGAITDNVKQEIITKVAKALDEGKGRGEVDQIIKETVDFWRTSKAETIALTEATHAYNEGVITTLESAGHSKVFVTDGDNHDDACAEADGSVWTIDHARANRLEHPNCRRAFLPLGEVG